MYSLQVSSSQEVTPTEFARTKRRLQEFKEQANKQEKMIKDLQEEKQRIEKTNKEMLRAVSKLNVTSLVNTVSLFCYVTELMRKKVNKVLQHR